MESKDFYADEKREMTSDFNEAKLQILRLNNLWEKCATCARSGRLIDWNWELDNIYGELSTDAEKQDEDKKEKETYSHKIKKINGLIAKHQKDGNGLYLILRTKEKILKRLQDNAGKGSKRSSDDEDDIDT